MQGLLSIGILLFQTPAPRPPASVISGRMVFADGAPAAGMVVVPVRVPESGQQAAPPPFPSRTNAMGAFRFLNLPPGRYFIRMGANGEAFIYYPGVATESDATVVTVTAGTNINDLNFTLPPSASGVRVLGHVTFPPNQTAPAETQRAQIAGPVGLFTSPIAADGTFEIPHVRPGRYTITVTPAPGMQPQPLLFRTTNCAGSNWLFLA